MIQAKNQSLKTGVRFWWETEAKAQTSTAKKPTSGNLL
jgi:hypothetical protein